MNGRHLAGEIVGKGSYRCDIHEGRGIVFRDLDGCEHRMVVSEKGDISWSHGRWRPEAPTSPTYCEIPLDALLPVGSENLFCAGRMIDCERNAYGALRVMVNCNQMGEGVARHVVRLLSEKRTREGLVCTRIRSARVLLAQQGEVSGGSRRIPQVVHEADAENVLQIPKFYKTLESVRRGFGMCGIMSGMKNTLKPTLWRTCLALMNPTRLRLFRIAQKIRKSSDSRRDTWRECGPMKPRKGRLRKSEVQALRDNEE